MPEEKPIEYPANLNYVILSPMGIQEDNAQPMHFVLMGPLSKEQLAKMGMVKDSSIT